VNEDGVAGSFALSEDELRFGPLATTRMAGPEQAMSLERDFLAALERATSCELDGRSLTFFASGDAVVRLAC
jgi:heat shock protein HslJ